MSGLVHTTDLIALGSPTGQARAWLRIAGVALLILLALIVGAAALTKFNELNPFSAAHQMPELQARANVAADAGDAARLQAEGVAAQAVRLDAYQQTASQAVEIRRHADLAAAAAPDAAAPLAPDRLARLRAADEQLCALQPEICSEPDAGAAAAGGDAGGGDPPLPAAAPARRPDPG